MQELDKGLSIAVQGEAAAIALKAFQEQLATWQVAMPPATPLVLDFGLDDFQRVGLIEYWIANELEAGYCGKYLYIHDGQTCPRHRHKQKHETFFIVKGRVRMDLDGEIREMGEGLGPALLLEVSQPCEIDDNYFENTTIPIGGNHNG